MTSGLSLTQPLQLDRSRGACALFRLMLQRVYVVERHPFRVGVRNAFQCFLLHWLEQEQGGTMTMPLLLTLPGGWGACHDYRIPSAARRKKGYATDVISEMTVSPDLNSLVSS